MFKTNLLLYSIFTFIFVSIISYVIFKKIEMVKIDPSKQPDIIYFDSLKGPATKTKMPIKKAASIVKYSQGSDSRLAILLTEPSAIFWLGLAHGLKTIGVPFIVTENYREALKHKVIFIYPEINNKISAAGLKELARIPSEGGTLITKDIYVGAFNPIFGIDRSVETNKFNHIHINSNSTVTRDFNESEEQNIKVGNADFSIAEALFMNPKEPPLATYENGRAAAIVQKTYPNNGKAYAIGVNIGRLALVGYDNQQSGISPYAKNHYEPTIDVFLRLIKNIYVNAQKNAVTLNTVPDGKQLAVLITHDLCFSQAYSYLETYADYEHEHNINATYFVTTKYIKDFQDIPYFNEANIKILMKIKNMGMALASHSVAHALRFDRAQLGTGKEEYPTYEPYNVSRDLTTNLSIMGELRVSRFLLQHFFPDTEIAAFRPGYLRDPFALPQSLEATGYKYSSSVVANDSLSHLPFQLNYNRDYTSEVPVFEFPITIDDITSDDLYTYLPQAIDLANKLKRYGGLFVILIHPNMIGQKFKFETEFVDSLGDTAWYGTINEFGDWWAARNEVEVDTATNGNTFVVKLDAPIALTGLTLTIPPNWHYASSSPANMNIIQKEQQIIIKQLNGKAQLFFNPR